MVLDLVPVLKHKKFLEQQRNQFTEKLHSGKRVTLSLRLRNIKWMVYLEKDHPINPDNYSPIKTVQVIAYFALKAGDGGIDLLRAIKLVHLADRDSIARTGEPILNEPRASLPLGPVNDLTYAFAKGERRDPEGWSKFLQDRDDNTLTVVPGTAFAELKKLSEADIESMDEVWKKFGFMHPVTLNNWTHKKGKCCWMETQISTLLSNA